MRTPHAPFGAVIIILMFHLSVYPHLPPPFISSARIILGPWRIPSVLSIFDTHDADRIAIVFLRSNSVTQEEYLVFHDIDNLWRFPKQR